MIKKSTVSTSKKLEKRHNNRNSVEKIEKKRAKIQDTVSSLLKLIKELSNLIKVLGRSNRTKQLIPRITNRPRTLLSQACKMRNKRLIYILYMLVKIRQRAR